MKNTLRSDAKQIWNAAVDAVRARPLVSRTLQICGEQLRVGDITYSRADFERVVVLGAGKAGAAMTQGLVDQISDWLPLSGWVNIPEGTEIDLSQITLHPARPAGLNEPTQAGVEGTNEILKITETLSERDLCIALISGGGSALLPAPIQGVSLNDKVAVTRQLSASGADIIELNTVRKHLSRIKGGGLRDACYRAHRLTLILSDVLGDPLDQIASGPTVEDTTTPSQALSILQKYDIDKNLPKNVYNALERATLKQQQNQPLNPCVDNTERDQTMVIGNNAIAVDEAGIVAEKIGYNHMMHSATSSEGLAEEVGRQLADTTLWMMQNGASEHPHDCVITGGEPVVQLCEPEIRGLGGRNQQLVLAAYQKLLEVNLTAEQWSRLCILSGGTDGEDGPTDAAGAFIDQAVHQAAVQHSICPKDYLSRNDAYNFFKKTGGLLISGPTGTNVCDVRVAMIRR